MSKIKIVSRWLKSILYLIIAFIALFSVSYWFIIEQIVVEKGMLSEGLYFNMLYSPLDVSDLQKFGISKILLSPMSKMYGFFVMMIPVSAIFFSLYQGIRLFSLYEKGKIFSKENVERYKKLGYAMFAWVGANVIYTPLMTFAITHGNISGQRFIALKVSLSDIATILVGGGILLISWVMQEGLKIADDQSHTI